MAILPPLMPVYGVHADANGIVVRVPPQGLAACTPTKDMMTVALAKSSDAATLLVARKRPDDPIECRNSGPAADIAWSYRELGIDSGQPIRLANPLMPEPPRLSIKPD